MKHKKGIKLYDYAFQDEINRQKIYNHYELKYNSLPNENVAFKQQNNLNRFEEKLDDHQRNLGYS